MKPPCPFPQLSSFDYQFTELAFTSLPAVLSELADLRARLSEYKLKVDQELSETRLRSKEAARRAAATHRYSDPKWFQATQAQIAGLGIESQRIQALMGEVSRRIRQLNGATKGYCETFVELSPALLPTDEFERISTAAHRVVSRCARD